MSDSSQEKTEQPTAKRKQKARDKGQVGTSKELDTTVILLAASGALLVLGPDIIGGLRDMLHDSFTLERAVIFDPGMLHAFLQLRMTEALLILVPLFAILVVAAVIGPVSLGAGRFASKKIAPEFNKINPISGLKRIFSTRGLMELGKAFAKFMLVTPIALMLLWQLSGPLLGLGYQPLEQGLKHAGYILAWAFLLLSATLILIALVDVPFQIWKHQKDLRMTKQEVKDEHRNSEGKPEVKRKIRQVQYEMSQRRMMAKVPQADVVVTNPTHFAVALQYDQQGMHAPKVVAKGMNLIADEIRARAKDAKVPLFEAPPLARALYYSTPLDQEIPASLYVAVAHILAYVYKLRTTESEDYTPEPPTDLPVPDELLRRASP